MLDDGTIAHRIELYQGANTATRMHELLHFEQASLTTGLMKKAQEAMIERDVL